MGMSGIDIAFLNDDEEKILKGLQQAFEDAQSRKDTAGMTAAHSAAQYLRAHNSSGVAYSGGVAGNQFIALTAQPERQTSDVIVVNHDGQVAKEAAESSNSSGTVHYVDPALNVNAQSTDTGSGTLTSTLPDSGALTLPSINIPQSTKSFIMYLGLGLAGLMVLKMFTGGKQS